MAERQSRNRLAKALVYVDVNEDIDNSCIDDR